MRLILKHNKIQLLLLLITLHLSIYSTSNKSLPEIISIDYNEQVLDIIWKEIPQVIGYNIYSRNSSQSIQKRRKVNKNLITSGGHFAFIWEFKDGKRERKIKGYEHIISIEAICSTNSKPIYSTEWDNLYFQGYRNISDSIRISAVIDDKQNSSYLPTSIENNKLSKFISFMEGPGQHLNEIVSDSINPLEVGGCAPVTTILVEILKKYGIYAYKAEGTFIKEYHSFVVLKINKIEYILDFTADQFLPKVSPVLIPRDECYLNYRGRISEKGKPIYTIARLYKPENVRLSDSEESRVYKNIRNEVLKRIKK